MTTLTAALPAPHPLQRLRNFGGNVGLTPPISPRTLDALVEILRDRGDRRVIPVGHAGSWSPVFVAARPGDRIVDLSALGGSVRLDTDARTVTAPGWAWTRDLHEQLSSWGFVLAHVPTWPDATLAGLIATDSHGCARDGGRIADGVVAMTLIGADGRRRTIDARGITDADTGERLAAGERFLEHTRVHLGALGPLQAVTLRVVPDHDLVQQQRVVPEGALLQDGLRGLLAHLDAHEHASAAWGLRQRRFVTRGADPAPPTTSPWRVSPVEAWLTSAIPTALMRLSTPRPWLAELTNDALMQPTFLRSVVRGRAWRVQTYIPARLLPSARLQTMEYFVPMARLAEALGLYERHLGGSPSQVPLNLRRIGERVAIESLWCDGFPGAAERAQALEVDLVEALGADALPHMGKDHWINPWPRLPRERVATFLEARALLDPQGAFESRYVSWLLSGEPRRQVGSWHVAG